MKILIVNYRYFISGGPEKYMFNIKRALEKEGHEVIPFSIKSNKNIETEYSKYFVDPIGDKNAVYYDEVKKTPKSIMQMLSRSIYSTEVKKAIKKEIKAENPDIVYIIHFVNKLSPSVIDGAHDLGVPVVLRLSDYFLLCPRFDFLYQKKVCEDCLTKGYRSCISKRCVKGSFFASLVRVISMKFHKLINVYRNVDAFITPSKFLKAKLVSNGFDSSKIYHIPTFTLSGEKEEVNKVGEYGLYFGRISEEKGVDLLVRAYEKMPNRKLKIAGDLSSEYAQRLVNYVSTNKLDNVEFLGFKQGQDLEDVIHNSRYVFIPSVWYDNLPNTALESFAHKKPIIASNIGSLPELVENGVNGYLFETGNIDDLISKVNLVDNEVRIKDFGENSYKKLVQDFSLEKHYNTLIGLFNNLKKKGEKRNG